MGKASRWFRNLLGLKKTDHHISPATQTSVAKQPSKKRWSLVKSSRETSKRSSERVRALPLQSPVLDDGDDPEKHAIAVAAATAAVAEAAVAAEQAAAEVVKLTSAGPGCVNSVANVGGSGLGSRENWAAVNIQSHFRAYLSRRALRALKALVKLQALVRGHIVRKQEAQKLRRMQAISRAQARARALRAQIYESSNSSSKSSHFHHPGPVTPEKYEHVIHKSAKHEQASMLKRNGSRSNGRAVFDKEKVRFNYSMDEGSWERVYSTSAFAAIEKNDKILEMDTGKPHVTPKKRNLFQSSLYPSASDPNSLSFTTSKDSTFHLTVPSPSSCEVQSLSPQKFMDNFEENFCTAENSPQFYSASSKGGTSMRGGPFTPTRSDTSRSYLNGYSDVPNYMSYTESSKAKVRSLSAPRQRSPFEISSTTKRFSVHGGYGDMRSYSTHRASYANFTSKAYPGSGRLDRLGMPLGGDGVGFSGGLRNKY